MRRALIVVIALAGCKDLPDIPLGLCGNHILDPGEECDSGDDPNCAPPGTADACHLKCGTLDGGVCPRGEICADTGFCRPTGDVCGNQVVEPNEDCEAPQPNCGAPDAGAHACRLLCTGGVACAAGTFCGGDQICRRPTGTYTLQPAFAGNAQNFGLLDVDGDNVLDLVGRDSSRVTFYRNDGAGNLGQIYATGAVHIQLAAQASPGVDTPRPPLQRSGLFAMLSTLGTELFAFVAPDQLEPVAAASSLLPSTAQAETFQGTVLRSANGTAEALYFDATSKLLVTYVLPIDYTNGATLQQTSTLDLTRCVATAAKVQTTISSPVGRASTLVLAVDNSAYCVAVPNAPAAPTAWTVTRLPLAAGVLGSDVDGELLADVDGDGHLDVVLHAFPNMFSAVAFYIYLWRPAGYSPPILVRIDNASLPFRGAVGDFNHDGRDDLVYSNTVYLNRSATSVPDGGFNADAGFEPQPLNAQQTLFPADSSFAADINRDGNADLVQTASMSSFVLVCIGDGSGFRFTCQNEVTSLPGVADVQFADVNGDQTTDVVMVGGQDFQPGLLDEPGLAVLLGRPLSTPDPHLLSLPIYRDQVTGAGRLPAVGEIADDLIVAIKTVDGKNGLALGHGDPAGAVAFDFPFFRSWDLRVVDDDGDNVPDVAVLQNDRVTVLHGGAKGGFAGGLKVYRGSFPDPSFSGNVPLRFADVGGDPLTVIGADLNNGLYVMHLKNGTYSQQTYPLDNPFSTFVMVQDLDGDGRNEIFVLDINNNACVVRLGRQKPGDAFPTFTASDPIANCSASNWTLADSAPFDGLVDFYITVTEGGKDHYQLFKLQADDKLDVAHPLGNPPAFVQVDAKTAVGFDFQSWAWLLSGDLNGDGIPDLLLATPLGAQVALADVRLR